jgi:hypothetical protein
MLSGIGPIPNLIVPLLGAVIGSAVGWWIQKWVVERRIKRHGINSERFLRKLAENITAKLPERISLVEVASPAAWSKPVKYELLANALQQLCFRRSGVFRGTPQKWIVEFWLSSEPGIFATIFDRHSKNEGIHSAVGIMNRDGSIIVFENTEECGLQHRQPDRWPHCGLVAPNELLERALRERHLGDAEPLDAVTCVRVYEEAVNQDLGWRRTKGISIEEMKNVLARMKKQGLLTKSTPPGTGGS